MPAASKARVPDGDIEKGEYAGALELDFMGC